MSKRKFQSILITCFITAATLGPARAQSSPETIVKKYRGGVVMLTVYVGPLNQKAGTGFLIGDDLIITNEHVIRGALSVYADFYGNSESIPCLLIDSDTDLDLAVLQLERKTTGTYPVLTLSDDADRESMEGADVILIGHPVKLAWSVVKGIVSAHRTLGKLFKEGILKIPPKDEEQRIMQLDVNTTFGMSGAPVFNTKEHVVGVQRLGYEKGEFGINFCIPVDYVRKLDTNKPPMKFNDGKGGGPKLDPNLQAFGMRPDNFKADPKLPFNIYSKAWGFAPNDADAIFDNYVGDRVGFERLVKKNILEQIVARGQGGMGLVHLTNPFFRYSLLVPNWFHLEEFPAADSLSMTTVLTYDDPQVPPGLNKVTIFTRKITPPGTMPDELVAEFDRQADWTILNQLKLTKVDPDNPPDNPGRYDVVLNAGLSDEAPRVHSYMPVVRFMRVYTAPAVFNRSYLTLYGLSGDTFTVLTFEFETSESTKQTDWNEDWVERLLITASLSFFN